jgi:hypothetical protein
MELFDGVRMANANKSSVFNDRRSVGSEKELDEYGVWVKSESEEFAVSGHNGSLESDFPPFKEKHDSTLSTSGGSPVAVVSGAETAKSGSPNADVMLSAALLLKIAEELALIKAELSALKSELDRRHSEGNVPVPPTPQPVVDNLPAETDATNEEAVTKDEVVEADFDVFGIDEAVGEVEGEDSLGKEQPVGADSSIEDEAEESEFFDADKSAGKITLTSDEMDLLGEDTSESVEEMEDPFLADNQDQEKIAFTGDEINDILGSMEAPAESALNEAAKVEEITFDDIPDEPIVESGPIEPKSDESAPDEDITFDDIPDEPIAESGPIEPKSDESVLDENVTFDINIESEEASASDDAPVSETKSGLDDEAFDIGNIEIDDDISETPVDLDKDGQDELKGETDDTIEGFESEVSFDEETFDIDTIEIEDELPEKSIDLDDAEADEPIALEPETADIAFDPFGSLPDEDVTDDAEPVTLEKDHDISAEDPLAEADEPAPADENAKVEEDASFTDFSVAEDSVFEDSFDDLLDSTASVDTSTEEIAGVEEAPGTAFSAEEITEAVPEAAVNDSLDETDIVGADADPVLSQLLDKDFPQLAPAPEDTSYLDDEKPLEFDEIPPESPEALVPPGENPDAPEDIPPSAAENPALQGVPQKFKEELKTVLSYMDILLESLPEEKIEEFARSEHFEPYKKLFKELGLA